MEMKFKINKILFELYLFFSLLGGVLRNVIGVWEQRYGTYSFISKGRLGTFFIMLSIITLFLLIIRCYIKYGKKVSKNLKILNIIIIIYYIIWTFISLINNSIQSVFFEGISTSLIIFPLVFILGYDFKIFNLLEKKLPFLCLVICCAFYFAVFSFWKQYGLQWPMNASYKGIFSYWITTMWLMSFIYINDKSKIKFIYSMLFLLNIGAFITQSRAWVLQTLILLFIIFITSKKNNRFFKIILGILFVLIVIVIISYIFPNITGNLFNRGLEDTRSGQYVVFFLQYSWKDLIFGAGLGATYEYLGNRFYPYFDNQFMFIIFHYGVMPVLYWLIIYFSLLKKERKIMEDEIIVAAKFVGFFVFLAYSGISTYYQIEMGYSSVLIMILFGNAIRRKNLI